MITNIYIAGPMSGYEDYNVGAFYKAANDLREQGYVVVNPATLPTDLSESDYLPINMAMLEACDTICMLDGWEESDGALAELTYALRQDYYVILYRDGKYYTLNNAEQSDLREALRLGAKKYVSDFTRHSFIEKDVQEDDNTDEDEEYIEIPKSSFEATKNLLGLVSSILESKE